jgi:uncharacterized RDD family membrane protein YckC
MPQATKQLDSTIEIGTPENIAFRYQVAGPFRRLPAFLIDVAIRCFAGVLIIWLLAVAGFVFQGIVFLLMFVTAFLLIWFYDIAFEILWSGQTPGKRLLGLRVLSADGQPVSPLQSMGRNILRWADLFPLLPVAYFAPGAEDVPMTPFVPSFLLGLFAMASNDRFQRLGDLVAGTMVVVEEKAWLMPTGKLDDPRATSLAGYIPATFVVSRTLAQALAVYVERRQFFSIPRRREIARHLGEPLVARFGFPADTSHDLLLMALYYRTFLQDEPGEVGGEHAPLSPYASNASPYAINTGQPPQPSPETGIVWVK